MTFSALIVTGALKLNEVFLVRSSRLIFLNWGFVLQSQMSLTDDDIEKNLLSSFKRDNIVS